MIEEGIVSDTLNLPGLRTLRQVSSNGQHTYESVSIEPEGPPCCTVPDRSPNGTKTVMFIDTPREGRPAIIHHKRRRWKCRCGSTSYEVMPWAEPNRGITARMADWLFKQATIRSFTSVANDAGIDPKTVRDIFADRAKPAVMAIRRKTPRVLGLDEKHIFGDYRAVMGDVEQRTMFWMLPARNSDTLGAFFDKIPDRETVEVVTIDMYSGYRKLIPDYFPGAVMVIDKFHITRYATMAMDRARASLRPNQTKDQRTRLMHQRWTLLKRRHKWEGHNVRTFEKIKAVYPDLAEIYEWKERVCEIFDAHHARRDAERAYLAWLDELPGRYKIFFKKFTTAMKNWGPQIFNYFDHRYTNAYIERLNGMVDDANRIGRGYGYRILFYKTMLQHGVPKKRPKRINRSRDILDGVVYDFVGVEEMMEAMLAPYLDEGAIAGHGPLLSTLSERFRDGETW